jgi:hypothetical protein
MGGGGVKLFIFEPSKGWDYCVGALGIIAETPAHARGIWLEAILKRREEERNLGLHSLSSQDTLALTDEQVPKTNYGFNGILPADAISGLAGHAWVLSHAVVLPLFSQNPGILFFIYNYS